MAYEQTQKISGATIDFGQTVAMQGYYAITSDDSVNGHFYRRGLEGIWSEVNSFTMTNATSSFGDALDIGNSYFIVGDPVYTGNGGAGVFSIDAPSASIQIFTGVAASDTFGDAVAISDDYILIGARGADSDRGDVYLYIKGTGATWTAYSGNPITPSLRMASDFFGCAVAISGDSLIIGAEGDNNKTGAVYIFEKNDETELWEESQKLFASDGNDNDQFGEAVSASGNYFVVGASLTESADGETNAGSAYVYKYGTSWVEVDKLVSVDETTPGGDHFGESVDINGDYIIVGSPVARATGVADIFYKKRSWGHLKKIVGRDSASLDAFGASVAISGRFALVGAPSESANGAIYYSEDPPVRLRLAQEFEVNGEYLPSKASVYLKKVGENTSNFWPIYNTKKTVIDASNFSSITGPTGGVSLSPISQWKLNDNEASPTVVDSRAVQNGNLFRWIGGFAPASVTPLNTNLGSELHTSPLTGMDRYLKLHSANPSTNGFAIIVGANSAHSFTDDFTDEPFSVSCWANFNDITNDGTMVAKVAADLSVKREWQFAQTENGKIKVLLYSQGSSSDFIGFVTDSVEVVNGQWYHLTFSYSAVAQDITDFKLYIDGSEVTIVADVDGVYTSMKDMGGSLGIGGIILQLGAPLFWEGFQAIVNASMDNVCIFDRVISQDDVSFLYQEGSGTEDLSGNPNQLIFDDEVEGFTGNGYIINNEDNPPTDSYRTVNYPIRAINPDTYDLWLRVINSTSNTLEMEILIDGNVTKTISTTIDNPSDDLEWVWVNTTIVLPDTREHVLGIKIKENGAAIDKIYIDASNSTPYSEGPDYGESPYLTLHMQVYNSSNDSPENSLFIYDYKNSIDQVVQSDWYNFNINVLDSNHGYTSAADFTGNYFLVMSVSGTTHDNFVVWEMADNDEYMTLPSVFRF